MDDIKELVGALELAIFEWEKNLGVVCNDRCISEGECDKDYAKIAAAKSVVSKHKVMIDDA